MHVTHGDSRSTSATDLDLESSTGRDVSGKAYAENMTPPSVAAASQGVLKVDEVFGQIKDSGPDYRAVRLFLPLPPPPPPPPTTATAVAAHSQPRPRVSRGRAVVLGGRTTSRPSTTTCLHKLCTAG
jgi:hypothetical protein